MTLADLLPTDPEPDALYDAFAGWAEGRGMSSTRRRRRR